MAKNDKLILRAFLLVLCPFSLLVLLHHLLAGPLMQRVEDGYQSSSLDRSTVIALVALEIPFAISFWAVSLFGTTITIAASAKTYTGKSLSLKELMFCLRSTWKKPALTWFYVSLLAIAYVVLSLVSTQLPTLIGRTDAASTCGWLIGILAALIYPYFATLWTVGLVISVVENDCHAAEAIARAHKLIGGRKLNGFFLMLILLLLNAPFYVLFYVTTADDDDELGCITRFAFMFVATVLFCLTNLFNLVVFTVFYFECKQNHGETMEIESGPDYSLVPPMVSA